MTENYGVEATSGPRRQEFKIEVDFEDPDFNRKGLWEMVVVGARSCAVLSFVFLRVASLDYVTQELKIG